MRHCDFLIIGAGPTGIGAAVRLGQLGADYLVVEAADRVGGMATSVTDEHGFTWDLGGHVLHSHFVEFDQAVTVSGVQLNSIRRNGWVWMDGRLIRTPVQQNLEQLPTDIRPDAVGANLADHYRNSFGTQLYETFFQPYTFKMWATPLEQIDHSWASLRSGSSERNVPSLGLARDFVPTRARFPYPVGGTGALWQGLYYKLLDPNRFLFRTRVVEVDLVQRIASLDDGQRVRFEHCVSSAPIVSAMDWVGIEFARLKQRLVASRVYVIGLGFRGEAPGTMADKTWLYCPDSAVPWYRATMLSNYDRGNAGDGRWNVLCEVSTSPHRPITHENAVRDTIASMEQLGAETAKLVTVWCRTVQMGYPVPTLGRDEIIRRTDERLLRHGVHSRGRFGGWRYESCNQDFSFVQGLQAVGNALFGEPEDVFWHPERF